LNEFKNQFSSNESWFLRLWGVKRCMTFRIRKTIMLLTISLLAAGILFPGLNAQAADRVQPVGEQIVIVIDPGHGGTNIGTQSGHTDEKVMTMATAKAMLQELEKYDNVKVYLTHSDDKDMSLAERAEFAASVNADFLFSIHYNASENHTMYGTEVWVSCQAPYNAYGYQFGYAHLQAMGEKGLFLRGVKTRIDPQNKNDYYGVIRESVALSVPAVIIEHCYVDEEHDASYIETQADWEELGRTDALSVAKYFGLKSTSLGVDYSSEASKLQAVSADSIVQSTLQDSTAPDVCEIELVECDYETGEVSLTVRAADYDSPLIYYNYSIDNGLTWSQLEGWPGSNALTGEYTDTFQLNLQIPGGKRPNIIVKAYNKADLETKSNVLSFDQTFATPSEESVSDSSDENSAATEPVEHSRKSAGTTTFMPAVSDSEESDEGVSVLTFLKLCLAFVIVLFVVVLSSQFVNYQRRKRHRRGR
jgi:N-acetylmuramoyl-L-alanine amidase